ncbi:MAG: PRC-barrel domain-containing protein [Clostridia bacterium]|nr:PRC-barrel domain-containing protein [Clostridia bacterium]
MEYSYNIIKKMDVVNVSDGKHLGRVCDCVFLFPENRIQGFYVTGGKGLHLTRQDIFLPLSAIIRVGEDVILTDMQHCIPQKGKRDKNRLPCPPQSNNQNFTQGNEQYGAARDRRNYDEYE